VSMQREAETLGRPSPGPEAAFTYELCAGIIDKDTSLQEIAADEVRGQLLLSSASAITRKSSASIVTSTS